MNPGDVEVECAEYDGFADVVGLLRQLADKLEAPTHICCGYTNPYRVFLTPQEYEALMLVTPVAIPKRVVWRG